MTTVDKAPTGISVSQVSFTALPGWQAGNPAAALGAWRRSCARILAMDPAAPMGGQVAAGTAGDWRGACGAIGDLSDDPAAVRAFVEANFIPYAVSNGATSDGLFTGYFEPIVRAAEHAQGAFNVPIHGLPADHVTVHLKDFDPDLAGRAVVGRVERGRLRPYHDRAAIAKRGADEAPVLFWADDALDVFVLQVQGSGIVELPDGRRQRIGFAGHNGHDYVSIGRWLLDQGELQSGAAAWQDIRTWMEQNPDRVADLLARNRRYIFFRPIDGDGAQGAAGVALTPEHSLAVDPKFLPLNVPLWLDTVHPGPGQQRLQRLVLAQDVGNAIRGPVRGDFFWGVGPDALALAGRMKSPGTYYLLLPAGVTPNT
ncbi:MAG: murein transglycosylase [Alphaproteobacteria bacterium]|nr:murein transglycosylase [Alphaproteobacteria bacterium]